MTMATSSRHRFADSACAPIQPSQCISDLILADSIVYTPEAASILREKAAQFGKDPVVLMDLSPSHTEVYGRSQCHVTATRLQNPAALSIKDTGRMHIFRRGHLVRAFLGYDAGEGRGNRFTDRMIVKCYRPVIDWLL